MTMSLEKAQTIVGKWRKNNFKAGKTLLELGYSESVAQKKPNEPINRALRIVAKHELVTIAQSDKPSSTLLEILDISEKDVADNYRYIIQQDKDMSTKLKALIPLLAGFGIYFDKHTPTSTRPTVNLTMIK